MTYLTTDPLLFWVLFLVCACCFALGVVVGVFGYRYVHGVPAVFRRRRATASAD